MFCKSIASVLQVFCKSPFAVAWDAHLAIPSNEAAQMILDNVWEVSWDALTRTC